MKPSNSIPAYERTYTILKEKEVQISKYYGEDIFSMKVMQQKLPKDVYLRVIQIINEGQKMDADTANSVAHAIKEWAIDKGATHYCHWFQP
jgi:glutamine synthetase